MRPGHRDAGAPHGLQPRAPRPGAPPIQEATRPGGGEVGPEELEVFLQEVGPDRLEVVPEELGQSALLRLRLPVPSPSR